MHFFTQNTKQDLSFFLSGCQKYESLIHSRTKTQQQLSSCLLLVWVFANQTILQSWEWMQTNADFYRQSLDCIKVQCLPISGLEMNEVFW